jgi:Cd2+/Zn2+-exporting ATPase
LTEKLKLDLAVLLPDVEDDRDQCVVRLQEHLTSRKGLDLVHVDRHDGTARLCLHYNPDLVTLAEVRHMAEQAGAAIANRYKHVLLTLDGMDCPDCALVIEHSIGRLDGVLTCAVNYTAARMRVEYDSHKIRRKAVVGRLRDLGYDVHGEGRPGDWLARHRNLAMIGVAGLWIVVGWLAGRLGVPGNVPVALFVLAYVAAGYDVAHHALKAARRFQFDTDSLMLVAALGAAILGEWLEGALLLFLFGLGHALEHYATDRARHAIRALADLSPRAARVRRDGAEVELPVSEVRRGDVVVVRPGERLPVDGRIVQGRSAIDQAPITGESLPVDKTEGDDVFAGTINGQGALEVEVTRPAHDTTLARIIQRVEEAQTQKSPTQRLTERITGVFVPAVLVTDLALIIIPPLVGRWSPAESFYRAMTLLVAASPCALAIGTPAAVLAGVAQAARHGVLIKGGVHLENLGDLDAIAFDKTGTITRGRPEVTDVICADCAWGDVQASHGPSNLAHCAQCTDLLRVAAAVETRSAHPLARAVVHQADKLGLALPDTGTLEALVGRGIQATLGGRDVLVGSLKLFEQTGQPVPAEVHSLVEALEGDGKTVMLVGTTTDGRSPDSDQRPTTSDQRLRSSFVIGRSSASDASPAVGGPWSAVILGLLALADTPRDEARPALARLKRMGIRHTVMLSGDNDRVASAIARRVGLDAHRANLLPEDKVQAVRDLAATYGRVAMVGDGVNDAPALASATVGIAMGGAASDAALEAADVALMGDDLSRLPFAVGLSRLTRRVIRQNLIIAFGVMLLLLVTSVLGLVRLSVAVVLHEGSTLVVVANALRLLRYRGDSG